MTEQIWIISESGCLLKRNLVELNQKCVKSTTWKPVCHHSTT